ncbi:MAG TPA: Maf family protein [Candidatus Saccharimonadales bacterium]|nr:Maf family protein [Candidatus Saccharimonadales bacterium]
MEHILYLASGSSSRRGMLMAAGIPFQVIEHTADESSCSLNQSLESLVTQLALLKMNHISIPDGTEQQIAFVLTADTMTLDSYHKLHGKPFDRQDAKNMLISCRDGALIGTAFCLQKKIFQNGTWNTHQQIVDYDQAWCVVDVPDVFLDFYLDRIPFTQVSGAITIEGFGEQFVKEVNGCYSAILGMPMYKLREALYALKFYAF